MATKLVTVEMDKPMPKLVENAENYDCVWAIVIRYGIPVGLVVIDNAKTPVLEAQLRGEITRQLSWQLVGNNDYQDADEFMKATGLLPHAKPVSSEFEDEPEMAHLLPELKPAAGQKFFLSIVVCTRDRPQDLKNCLASLLQLDPGRHQFEIIVVDNNPASGQTEPIVRSFAGVRYEIEKRPGVGYARNQGLRAAKGDIVAYIDDDVVVTCGWVTRILAPFADKRVMCVSGLVLPLELENTSQEMFERYGGLGRGYAPRIFDTEFFNWSKRRVVPTWFLGGTANVAIRKSVIRQTGMFDETLGPGQPTGVGEDIYMFYRILKFGHICYYEPAAYVWHKHRSTMTALKHQIYSYSKGQISYQLRTLISDGDTRAIWQLFWDLPFIHTKRALRILLGRYKYPLDLLWEEVRGNLVGPYAFYKAVKTHRKLNGPNANPIQGSTELVESTKRLP